MRGTVRTHGDVSIGESGRLEGTIQAERLVVSGHLEGDVDCHALEIVANGRVHGDVHSDTFVIEPGGIFRGQSHARDEQHLALTDQQERPHALPGHDTGATTPADDDAAEPEAAPGRT